MNLEQEIEQLVIYGKLINEGTDPLELLRAAAQQEPDLLFKLITEVASGPMIIPSVAAFLCTNNPNFSLLPGKVQDELFALLLLYSATDLLLLVEIIRSKVFGRGLGSRNQKLIRRVLEAWTETDLKENIMLDDKAVYALLRLIHPRYTDRRSLIIKDLIH